MVAILQKAIKELNDECENYRKANNTAEVIKIEAQKELVEKFLPAMMTEEEIYIMTLVCNDLVFEMCNNKEDLYGEPKVGR